MRHDKEIERLKSEVAEIESRIEALGKERDEKSRRRYELERDRDKNQRPTPAMLRVLAALVDGAELVYHRWVPDRYFLRSGGSGGKVTEYLTRSVYYGLISRQAIQELRKDDSLTTVYGITANGERWLPSRAEADHA